MAKIDGCIAPIVKALQRGGIDMRASCCGHGKGRGSIHLQDGRTLLILPFLGLAWCKGRTRAKKQVPNQWNYPRLLNRSQRARGPVGLPVSSES